MFKTAVQLLEKQLWSHRVDAMRETEEVVNTIQQVVEIDKPMEQDNHFLQTKCLFAILNVKKVFNSPKQELDEMKRDFVIPQYQQRILGRYLNERFLTLDTVDDLQKK